MEKVFEETLVPLYSQPHRAYHNLSHIQACFDILDRYGPDEIKENFAVSLALFFHDAVYDTQAGSNEEKSAELLQSEMARTSIEPSLVSTAANMILFTKHNVSDGELREMPDPYRYVVDVDLSILGASPEVFDRYDQAIRDEYEWVPLEIYLPKRKEVLQGFLDRDWVYETRGFRQSFEGQARENLRRAIEKIR